MTSRARPLLAALVACSALTALGLGQAAAVAAAPSQKDKPGGPAHVDASRPLVISEFRLRGPNGANDEFIEITNVSGADHTVSPVSGTGYALAASNGVARCVIPTGTVIPAFGSYLCVNSVGYSLASYPAGNGTTATGDATYTTDIPDNVGLALFDTSVTADFTLANRLDAAGSTAEANTLYKEGTGYPSLGSPFNIDSSFYRNLSTPSITDNTPTTNTPGLPQDTDDNAADFVFVDTNGTSNGAGQRLGAPGPSNLSSPRPNGKLAVSLLDPCVSATAPPNAVRDFTSDSIHNSTFGTTDLRRTITNNTGGPVTRLRLRVDDIRTFPAPSGISDLRPRTSTSTVVTVDRAPCGTGTSNVSVDGTTLEQPPSQPNGGGFNSSLSVGTITLATPLAAGASVDVRLLLGIQQTGNASVRVTAEALTGGDDTTPDPGTCLPAPSDGVMECNSNGTDILVPGTGTVGPASPYPSTITTSFPVGSVVTDVDVTLQGETHTFPNDIDALLVAPDGATASMIMSDAGGGHPGASNVSLTLDDEAVNPVPTPVVAGTYQPTDVGAPNDDAMPAPAPAPDATGGLSNFDGLLASGTWSLYVADDVGGDSGSISGWSLDITVAAATCDGLPVTVFGTDASETITGTPGVDVISGFGGDDVINADAGNDHICGGIGDDEIHDQGGLDKAFGGPGDDLFAMTASPDGADLAVGGPGEDQATYAARTGDVSLTINGAADDGATGEHDKLLTVEDLTGGEGNDFLSGNSLANELFGKGGDDRLRDFPGADQVFGGDGQDTFVAPSNPDAADGYTGGLGDDKILYASRSAAVSISLDGVANDGTGAENDNLVGVESATGGGGADTIVGSAGINTLIGGGGADTITDLGGPDSVNGGGGADTLVQSATADGSDDLNGGPGVDTITYALRAGAVTITLGSGPTDDGAVGEHDSLIAIENALGGSGFDKVWGTTGDNELHGGAGNDDLKGFAGADDLYGEADDDHLDTFDGVGGNDLADGGPGTNDFVLTDAGDTVVNVP